MIKTTFRIIKDKPSGANDLSAERTYLNKVWVDRDSEVNFLSNQISFIEISDVHSLEDNIRKRIKELKGEKE